MTNYKIKIDYATETLILPKAFSKKASIVGTKEYIELQEVRALHPNFKITVREIKKNPSKNSFKDLTYDYMRSYIKTYEEEEKQAEVLAEMDKLIFISQCHSKSKRYPVIKQWFLNKYPEVKQFGMPTIEEETSAEEEISMDDTYIRSDNVADFPTSKTA